MITRFGREFFFAGSSAARVGVDMTMTTRAVRTTIAARNDVEGKQSLAGIDLIAAWFIGITQVKVLVQQTTSRIQYALRRVKALPASLARRPGGRIGSDRVW